MGVVIADFSKIEVRLKALYVRFWGMPEGGLKALQIKTFKGGKQEHKTIPCSYLCPPYVPFMSPWKW